MPTLYDSETAKLAKSSIPTARLPIDDDTSGAKYIEGRDVLNIARYLGRYANEAAATTAAGTLQTGDLYLDTSENKFRVYDGSAFEDVTFTASGGGDDSGGGDTSQYLTETDIENLVRSITISGQTLTVTKQDDSTSEIQLPGEAVYRVYSSLRIEDIALTTEAVSTNNQASTQELSYAASVADNAELGLSLAASDHVFRFTNISTAEDRLLHISGFVPVSHIGGGGALQVDFNEYLSTSPTVVNRTTRLFLEGLADADRVCEFKAALNQTLVNVRKDRLYRIVVTFTKTSGGAATWGIDYPANGGEIGISFSPAAEVADELPDGGAEGQVLTKASATDGDVEWSDSASGVPDGGAEGQVLAKASATDGDVEWRSEAEVSTPPAEGGPHYFGDSQDGDGNSVSEWRPVDDILALLTVETLPDPDSLQLNDIRFSSGVEPGRHTVIPNPESPRNSLILKVGTDSSDSTEHGASLYAASGGEYGEFLRNHDGAVAAFIYYTGTNGAMAFAIKDQYVNSDGTVLPAITIVGSRAATFTYTLSYDAQGDFTEGAVQFRHYKIASVAEGGPGITASDFADVSDDDELGLLLYSDSSAQTPVNINPAHAWRWDDKEVTGSVIPEVYDEDPSITGKKPGTLIVSDHKLKYAQPRTVITPDNQNEITLNMAGHNYGLPGSAYARANAAAGEAIDDPRSFMGQMDWYRASQGNGGVMEMFLRDDDMEARLGSSIVARAQLFGRSAEESYSLTKSADDQGQYINGVFYARYSGNTSYYVDDHLFNGFQRTAFKFFASYTSESDNVKLNAVRGSNVVVPARWQVAGFELGPELLVGSLPINAAQTEFTEFNGGENISKYRFMAAIVEYAAPTSHDKSLVFGVLPETVSTDESNPDGMGIPGGSTGLINYTQTHYRYTHYVRLLHSLKGVY